MRITNSMMTNTTLININRNMRYLDKLTQQIESTKKIQVPSDDPVVASRALKFRTNITETEQFQRNVQSGLAWMNVSETSYTNIVNTLLKQFRERCVEAATGTETASDKAAIVAELRELVEQIGLEMNQTYAGRYVFSGFRTNEPPILVDNDNSAYIISQYFNVADIEKTKSYQKLDIVGKPEVYNINVLKLAYKNVDFDTSYNYLGGTPTDDIGIYKPDGTKYNIVTTDSSSASAYTPLDDGNTIHYVADTGELVFGNQVAAKMQNGTRVTYFKDDIQKGELNPLVYFPCTELVNVEQDVYYLKDAITGPVTGLQYPDLDPLSLKVFQPYAIIDVKESGYPYDPNNPSKYANQIADYQVLFDKDNGYLIMNDNTAALFDGTITYKDAAGVTYTKTCSPGNNVVRLNDSQSTPALPIQSVDLTGINPLYSMVASGPYVSLTDDLSPAAYDPANPYAFVPYLDFIVNSPYTQPPYESRAVIYDTSAPDHYRLVLGNDLRNALNGNPCTIAFTAGGYKYSIQYNGYDNVIDLTGTGITYPISLNNLTWVGNNGPFNNGTNTSAAVPVTGFNYVNSYGVTDNITSVNFQIAENGIPGFYGGSATPSASAAYTCVIGYDPATGAFTFPSGVPAEVVTAYGNSGIQNIASVTDSLGLTISDATSTTFPALAWGSNAPILSQSSIGPILGDPTMTLTNPYTLPSGATTQNVYELTGLGVVHYPPTSPLDTFPYVSGANDSIIASNWLVDGEILFDPTSGKLLMNDNTYNLYKGATVSYKTADGSLPAGTTVEYFAQTEKTTVKGNTYTMDNQNIQYEFSTNTFVTVNSLSKNVYTDKMYADLLSICEFAEKLVTSDSKLLQEKYAGAPYNLTGDDLTKAVNDQLTAEKAELQAVLYDRFNNMLYKVDNHAANVMKEQTQMGSRMERLELIQARLEQDEGSYTQLMSDNEDTDLTKAIVLKYAAEAAYQASLKVAANIVQMTLANYIG